ncbi:ribose 5-phosphate isomerase B [Chloroflexota bacterium]
MKIAIGADHRGIEFKNYVIGVLKQYGHEPADMGTHNEDAVDYPDIAGKVGGAVVEGEAKLGILICGTGIGMCIAANKVRGVRAANCVNAFMAMRARAHNDANIFCLGAEMGKAMVPAMLEAFLTTEFEGGRHQRRIEKIASMEECG